MFTVALIGPDGAGKTTIGRRLEHLLPLPVTYMYMGVNPEAGTHMLPTTRLLYALKQARGKRTGQARPAAPPRPTRPKNPLRRAAARIKSGLLLANRLSEEWYRQALAWYYTKRRTIVLFDRHFFSDYNATYALNPNSMQTRARRLHGFLLEHIYPQPDLVIYLDAPAEVLFARKGEGTLESLEHQRQQYLKLRNSVKHFATVDATQPENDVVRDVAALICQFYQARASDVVQMRNVQR